jgi:Fe-S-cluster containining protein
MMELVLKLGELCPFLNKETEECECRSFKPIICKIYPIVFTVEAGKVSFTIDDWCQLSRKKVCRNYFISAIPLLYQLPIPVEWFRYVISYDDFCFDYDQLRVSRRKKNKYAVFTLQELLSFRKMEVQYKIKAYTVETNNVDMYKIKTIGSGIDFCQEIEEPMF